MTRMNYRRTSSRSWTPTHRHEPTPEEIAKAAAKRAQAKAGTAPKIVKESGGIPCPRCGQPTEIRTHARITPKLKRKTYYRRWYYCVNPNCRTKGVYRDEDRSDVDEDMQRRIARNS